jgi:hypothetical protein
MNLRIIFKFRVMPWHWLLALAVTTNGTPAAGQPVAGRPVEAAVAPASTGALVGRVLISGTDAGLGGVEVVARGPEGHVARTVSDAAGTWRLEGLAPGTWRLHLGLTDWQPRELSTRVVAGSAVATGDVELAPLEVSEDIQVVAQAGPARRLRESSESVTVVELGAARERAADLSEVLRRVEGVTVQRTGALGAPSTLSLNGLMGSQVRVFVDGVPLELSGWGADLGSVPVPLLERVEVYKGVVPLRLGADALGGAINLVTDERLFSSFAHASYQLGSFGTHRLSGAARKHLGTSGLVTGASLFLDRAANDYAVDVQVADAQGRLSEARVPRFHDGYDALGAGVEAGVVGRRWADVLLLRAGYTRTQKQLQHNPIMSVPYGEATTGSSAWTLGARYRKLALAGTDVEAVLNLSTRRLTVRDASTWVYDWFGQRVRERRVAGELGTPRDAYLDERAAFARLNLSRQLAAGHRLWLSTSPQVSRRQGDDRLDEVEGQRDLLNEPQSRASLVSGVGWELRGWGERLENNLFLKHYLFDVSAVQQVRFGELESLRRGFQSFGVGNAARLRLSERWALKLSYEWATRLPTADEVFGDGVLVVANPELRPELSHNLNLGLQLVEAETSWGQATADVTAFARDTRDQVILMVNSLAAQHQNVLNARAVGLEAAGRWEAPGGWLWLQASGSYTDVRNTAQEGTFAPYQGQRLPNRPFLSAAAELRLRRQGLVTGRDAATLFFSSRYTHAFFRGWEGLGARDSKQQVPSQWMHTAGVTWALPESLSVTLEVANLANARLYDVVGVQGPGRAFSLKVAGSFDLSPQEP